MEQNYSKKKDRRIKKNHIGKNPIIKLHWNDSILLEKINKIQNGNKIKLQEIQNTTNKIHTKQINSSSTFRKKIQEIQQTEKENQTDKQRQNKTPLQTCNMEYSR